MMRCNSSSVKGAFLAALLEPTDALMSGDAAQVPHVYEAAHHTLGVAGYVTIDS